MLRIELEDVNEFGPEFERNHYEASLELPPSEPDHEQQKAQNAVWCHLLSVRAHDQDCSREFGQVCRYELQPMEPQQEESSSQLSKRIHLRADSQGNIQAKCAWLSAQVARQQSNAISLKVIAFDCGGRKSQAPASVQVNLSQRPRAAVAATVQQQQQQQLAAAPSQVPVTADCRPAWKGE